MADAPGSVWMYTPSFALAIIASILYGIIFIDITYLTLIKHRAWYFLCVPIGAAIEVAGYALRCYSIKNPTEIGPFASTLSLIVLAPVFIAAGNYLLIGRLIRAVLAPSTGYRVFGVHGRKITRIFVIFDIISFLVQCAGSGVASSVEWVGKTADVGIKILIGGLALQAVAFSFFLAIFSRFHYLARHGCIAEDAPLGWEKVVRAVYVSSLLILVRCIYRVAEFSEGVDGYSFRHEWLFWVFESAPMLIAILVFCIWHPSACLGRDGWKGKIMSKGGESVDSEEGATELRQSRRSGRRRH